MRFTKYLGLAIASIEWYDNAICIALADVLSTLFFPQYDTTSRLILYLSSFAIGFLGRPIGAYFLGYYSDKYSRIHAAYISFVIMILGTLFISILPTYQSIGIYAPILLVLFRFFQGIAIGGNYGISVFSVENAHKSEKYFASSMICLGFMIGFFFGGVVSSMLNYFSNREMLLSIGWRIALLSSFFISLPVLFWFPKDEPKQLL